MSDVFLVHEFVGFCNKLDGSVRVGLMVQSAETQFQNHPLQIDQRFQSITIEDSDSEACQTGCSFSAADREFHAVSSPVSSWNRSIQASDEASVSHPQSSCEYHALCKCWIVTTEQTPPLLWIHISIFITILCQVVPSSMMGVRQCSRTVPTEKKNRVVFVPYVPCCSLTALEGFFSRTRSMDKVRGSSAACQVESRCHSCSQLVSSNDSSSDSNFACSSFKFFKLTTLSWGKFESPRCGFNKLGYYHF